MMEISKFIQNFIEELEDTEVTEVTEITGETIFKDLPEWSSLTSLSIIAMCDEKYDVTLRGDDINNAITIEDLFNIVKSKV